MHCTALRSGARGTGLTPVRLCWRPSPHRIPYIAVWSFCGVEKLAATDYEAFLC